LWWGMATGWFSSLIPVIYRPVVSCRWSSAM
jgi:hypothetical protein